MSWELLKLIGLENLSWLKFPFFAALYLYAYDRGPSYNFQVASCQNCCCCQLELHILQQPAIANRSVNTNKMIPGMAYTSLSIFNDKTFMSFCCRHTSLFTMKMLWNYHLPVDGDKSAPQMSLFIALRYHSFPRASTTIVSLSGPLAFIFFRNPSRA